MTNTNTNTIVANATNEQSLTDKAADYVGIAAEWTADAIEDCVMTGYETMLSGYERSTELVVRLAQETPNIRAAARAKAQARLDARYGKRAA